MRPVLVSYFDLGVSYGLNDGVFPDRAVVKPDIGMVGFDPPLGRGVNVDVPARLVAVWTEEAGRQAHRDTMETGRTGPRDEFDGRLESTIRSQPVERCTLTIHAIGTVIVQLWLGPGIHEGFLRGVMKCYEYAAYRPAVAGALHGAASSHLAGVLQRRTQLQSPLTTLTRRDLARPTSDPSETEPDGTTPYVEQMLMPSFTHVLVCIDPGDDPVGGLRLIDPDSDPSDRNVIDFEFHGQIHCGWAACAIVARRLVWPGQDPGLDEPSDQVKRMLACLAVAHVAYGTCEAFERLFLGEVEHQVDGYLRRAPGGRAPDELNRLRNMALAVVTLSRFPKVTESAEDQAYLAWFEQQSAIEAKRDFIAEAAEIVYNVAEAETQARRSARERLLNVIVLLLTSLTLLSVSADAYDFIRDNEALIGDRAARVRVLVEFLLGIALLISLALLASTRRR